MTFFTVRTMPRQKGTERQVETALLVLRVAVGVIFFVHGYQKFFTMGVGGVAGFFGSVGVPLPGLIAPAISTLETFGGLALILGLLTRWIAPFFVLDMAGAIYFVHWGNGFFAPKGIELVMLLGASALALALAGPGRFSVDGMLSGGAGKSGTR